MIGVAGGIVTASRLVGGNRLHRSSAFLNQTSVRSRASKEDEILVWIRDDR
jgi:hypothetical protein